MHRLPIIIVLLCLLVSCGPQREQGMKPAYKPTDTTLLDFYPLNKPEKYGWMWVYPDQHFNAFLNMNLKTSKSREYLPGDSIVLFNGDAFATMEHYMFYDDFTMWNNDGLIHVFALNKEKFGIIIQPGMTKIYRLANQHFVQIGKVPDAVVKTPCSIHFCDFNFDGYTDLVLQPDTDRNNPPGWLFTGMLYDPAGKVFNLLEGEPIQRMAINKTRKAIYGNTFGENRNSITTKKYHVSGNRLVCTEAVSVFTLSGSGPDAVSRFEHWIYNKGMKQCDSVTTTYRNAEIRFNLLLRERFDSDNTTYLTGL